MSVLAVAEKDFRDAIRSRLMIGVALLFVVFTGGGIALIVAFTPDEIGVGSAIEGVRQLIFSSSALFVPIVALGIGFKSIAGERQSGSLKLLLSLPNSRLDVVVGKFLGRTAVVSVAVVLGFLSLLIGSALSFDGDLPVLGLIGAMVAILLLAVVFVSIAVGISASTGSIYTAALAAGSFFVLFRRTTWGGLIFLIRYVANGFERPELGAEPPEWAEVLTNVNPLEGWQTSAVWLIDTISENGGGQQTSADAFYLEPWFGFVVLAFWILAPLVVGYLAFESSDL